MIQFTASQLLPALATVTAAAPRRATIPIMENVLIDSTGDTLRLTCTDLTMQVSASADVTITDAQKITMPAHRLLALMKALPKGKAATLDVAHERATLKCGRSRYTLETLPANVFPEADAIKYDSSMPVGEPIFLPALQQAISKASRFSARQDVRYYLNGVHLLADGANMLAVATDGHRLICVTARDLIDLDGVLANTNLIVPASAFAQIGKLTGTEAVLAAGPNAISLTDEAGTALVVKLVDGEYPQWRKVVPSVKDLRATMTVDRDELVEAMHRLKVGAGQIPGVEVLTREASIIIKGGDGFEELDAQIDAADPVQSAYNVSYLLDMIESVGGDSLTLGVAPNGTLRLADADTVCVVMPMRL